MGLSVAEFRCRTSCRCGRAVSRGDRRCSGCRALTGELWKCEEAELVRGLAGVEEHAEICRGQLPDLKHVLFFYVVGNEPVILLVAELVEVSPDVERLLQQKESVCCGERAFFLARRRIEPDGDERCDCPEQQDWTGREQGSDVGQREERAR